MSCESCGTKAGKPGGCRSNGGCQTGNCNRMNTYDWLQDMPLPTGQQRFPYVEVSFKRGQRKEFFKNTLADLITGDMVCVEGVNGFDIGMISLSGELVRLQMKKHNVHAGKVEKRILRLANDMELKRMDELRAKEKESLIKSRAIAKTLKLNMKISDVEYQADGRKAIFYYIADGRVDFRELIKVYAKDFNVKVEMKQIGSRQEAGLVGGIGSCGRELCCSTWLTDFKNVNVGAARYQNLSINQTKLSGQCGRLKCCLNYELDTYLDALKEFPKQADKIVTKKGDAWLQKTDIFKFLMWYGYHGSTKLYPLSIERVNELLALNKEGKHPEDLEAYKEILVLPKADEVADVDLVGQTSLSSLRKTEQRNKNKNQKQRPKQKGAQQERKANPKQQPVAANPNQPSSPAQQKGPNPNPNQKRKNKNRNRPGGGSRPGSEQKPTT